LFWYLLTGVRTDGEKAKRNFAGKVNYLSGKGLISKIALMYHMVSSMLISSFEEGGQGV